MLLYSDVITDDEMFSDAFPLSVQFHFPLHCHHHQLALQEGGGRHRLWGWLSNDHYKTGRRRRHWFVKSNYSAWRDSSLSAAGANPSAEEQEDSLEEGAVSVNNVIHSFRLQGTAFDKKSYLTYLKVGISVLLVLDYDSPYLLGVHERNQGKIGPRSCASFRDRCPGICQKDCRKLQGLRVCKRDRHCLQNSSTHFTTSSTRVNRWTRMAWLLSSTIGYVKICCKSTSLTCLCFKEDGVTRKHSIHQNMFT